MIFYVVELLDDWNVDVASWKYPRNLESDRVSSPGFGNVSKMMVKTDLHLHSVTITGHIYRDVILEQHVRFFRAWVLNSLWAPWVLGENHPYGLAIIFTGLESNRACVGYAWRTNCSLSTRSHLSTVTSEGID
ncbi:DDE_3 domain-containing protein [Trichonephila clavipes]|nr:DDE_3 domain-containing protein [Trichonephila clavipes]